MSSVAQLRAGRQARRATHAHYENFPVASLLLPQRMRTPIALIYSFARRADDIADEGSLKASQRLEQLTQLRQQLDLARAGQPCGDPSIDALGRAVTQHRLPWQPLYDLLSAFSQDVTVNRYASFADLADYCRRSANPVGRLLLHLFDAADDINLAHSDAVCTALQLLNFAQDLDSDFQQRGRIYVPLDEMARFNVDESHFQQRRSDRAMRALVMLQCDRAVALLERGAALGRVLPGRLGLEIRATIAGGRRIAAKLQRRQDIFSRPRLNTVDWLAVTWSAFRT